MAVAATRQQQFDPLCARRRRCDGDAVPAQFRRERERVVQVLVACAQGRVVLDVGFRSQRQCGADLVLEPDDCMVDALRWLEILDAVLDLQLLDALELLVASPAREQMRTVGYLPCEIEARPELVAGFDRIGLPSQRKPSSPVSVSVSRARTV